VEVSCTAQHGFPDGDTPWYLIASHPWSNRYYAMADYFVKLGSQPPDC
jgi:hypothetical protein